jgi:hypothetical protein
MNHQILGLSSRSVSLTRYTLQFHISNAGLSHNVSLIIHHTIQVQLVEEMNACVNVNSCRVVVAVRLDEK